MSDTHDCAGEAAPYVLGALEPEEASRFEQHLLTCAVCQEEVASMRELTDSLALSVPQMRSPRRVRRHVMRQVRADASTRQQPSARVQRSRLRLGAGATALAAVAAVVVILITAAGSSTQIYPASVGQAQVRVTDKHAELVVHHLKHLGTGRVYEVWLRDGTGAPQPTSALFDVSSRGDGAVRIPGTFEHVDEVLVTAEPAGGSAVPTTTPVVVARTS